jgi:hypothetical protein
VPLWKNNTGVGGFSEDIPILRVIIIGFGIFLVSVVNSYTGYQVYQDVFRIHGGCQKFTKAIISYDARVHKIQEVPRISGLSV